MFYAIIERNLEDLDEAKPTLYFGSCWTVSQRVLRSRSMVKKSPGITLKIVLEHIQGMRYEFSTRFDRLEKRMDGLEKRMGHIEERMYGMECRVSLVSASIDTIDNRLDMIEIETLPKRVSMLEKKVGIAIKR